MRWAVLLLLLLLLPAAGCGRTPGIPDDNGAVEDARVMDLATLLGMDAGELSPVMRGDNWHLRLAAGATLPAREDLPLSERVALLVQALEHEIENPSAGPVPMGVYLPPAEYARLSLAGIISQLGPEAIPDLRQAAGKSSAGARDYIVIVLASLGDRDAAAQVRDLLAVSPSPWLRMESALALGMLGDHEAVPLLTEALQDPFMTTAESCAGQFDVFPVRESAAAALRTLGVAVERLEDGIFEIGE